MRLIWKLPDNDGGERIKSYFIEKKAVNGKAWTVANAACASMAFVVSNLLEGQDYLFRVRAENRLGFGPFTKTTEPVRARDPICKLVTLVFLKASHMPLSCCFFSLTIFYIFFLM